VFEAMVEPLQRLILATGNPHKARELVGLLTPLGVPLLSLADVRAVSPVEEDGVSVAENARKKAGEYAQQLREWVLSDDTALCVDALAGAPGVRSARYAGEQADMAENRAKLLADLESVPASRRTARFVCALAIANPAGRIEWESTGVCSGRILYAPSTGTGGFGYDVLFAVEGHGGATLAELPPDVVSAVGHRGRAARQLLARVRRERLP
jgi:XTP/dITP diphosphohydrolase